jgi:hypothetical protein
MQKRDHIPRETGLFFLGPIILDRGGNINYQFFHRNLLRSLQRRETCWMHITCIILTALSYINQIVLTILDFIYLSEVAHNERLVLM